MTTHGVVKRDVVWCGAVQRDAVLQEDGGVSQKRGDTLGIDTMASEKQGKTRLPSQ